jgi:hypothetical protein
MPASKLFEGWNVSSLPGQCGFSESISPILRSAPGAKSAQQTQPTTLLRASESDQNAFQNRAVVLAKKNRLKSCPQPSRILLYLVYCSLT